MTRLFDCFLLAWLAGWLVGGFLLLLLRSLSLSLTFTLFLLDWFFGRVKWVVYMNGIIDLGWIHAVIWMSDWLW